MTVEMELLTATGQESRRPTEDDQTYLRRVIGR